MVYFDISNKGALSVDILKLIYCAMPSTEPEGVVHDTSIGRTGNSPVPPPTGISVYWFIALCA